MQGKNKRNKKLHNVSLKHDSRLKFLPSKSRKALMIVRMIISFVFIFCRHIPSMKQAAKIREETFGFALMCTQMVIDQNSIFPPTPLEFTLKLIRT